MGVKKHLDTWTAEKLSEEGVAGFHVSEDGPVDGISLRQALDRYTEGKLKETLRYAVSHSNFYKEMLGEYMTEQPGGYTVDMPGGYTMDRLGDGFMDFFGTLPFTTPEQLRKHGMEMLCVSPGQISRIVTLDTGGSTGAPKRIHFTEEDQQLTVDYFQHGMQLLANGEDTILILMPAKIPGSIGKLLAEGLRGFGAKAVEYGLPSMGPSLPTENNEEEINRLLGVMKKEKVTAVVALPTHMRMLAEAVLDKADAVASEVAGSKGRLNEYELKAVLLSSEYVGEEDVKIIESAFGCRVYEHYGMTEMGLGCAVSCGRGRGYHVRETDLYLEIVDPETGEVVEDGRLGEVVFTTLTRKGMPFIRYRTGDYSRWITEPCGCGSILKRLDKVGPRHVVKGYLREKGIKGV